jgi:transposase
MTRSFARAPCGERARGSVPSGRWRRLTVLGALSVEGMVAAMSIEAATDKPIFLAFLRAVLVPELRRRHPHATVLMDNLSAHKDAAVEAVLTQAGLNLLYLPRYSPDFSPIEPSWSKLKGKLRTVAARTAEALETALGPAIDSITPADARGWFNFCGYPSPS